MEATGKKLAFIQALRGLAVMAVVLYHGSRFLGPYGTGIGWTLFGSGGSMGVDLFFVISGFIMVYTTRDADGSANYALAFAIKRWTRLWPTYAVITIIYIIATWGWAWFLENPARLATSLTFIPLVSRTPVLIDPPAIGVGWSLNYEVYFYAVFGISLLFTRRWPPFFGWMLFALLVIPMLTGERPALAETSLNPILPAFLQIAINPLVWLFIAGVLIGLVYRTRAALPAFWASVLATTAIACWLFQFFGHFQSGHGVAGGGFSAILLVLCLTLASKTIELEAPRFMVFLGNISYSLYLLHPLAQERLEAIFRASGNAEYASGVPFLLLTTVFAILLAMISHRFLEGRLSDWARTKATQTHRLAGSMLSKSHASAESTQ